MTHRFGVRSLQALVLLVVAALAAACGGSSLGETGGNAKASTQNQKVKIGMLVSLSGAYAPVGTDMKKGFDLYLEQHHKELGGHEVDLDTVDEGSSAQSGVAGDTKLAQQSGVDAVVGIVSGPTAAAGRDIFDSAKIPVLLGNTGSVDIGKNPSPWIYRASYDNGDPGRLLGKHMAKQSSGDFYLLGADYSGGHETLGGFEQTFPKNRIAGQAYFPPFGQTSDFSPYLAKIRASGAKNVFAFGPGADSIKLVKQFHQFGLDKSVTLYGAGFLTEGSALTAQGDAALGVMNATRYSWDIDNPVNKQFVDAYQQKYGSLPTVYAANMYDIAIMLDKAIGSIKGNVDRDAIKNAIAHLGTVDGVRGQLSFNNDNTVVQDFYLTKVEKTDQGLRNVIVTKLGRTS